MAKTLKYDRIDVIEIVVLLLFLAITIGLKLWGKTGYIPIIGCIVILAMIPLWVLSAKKYSISLFLSAARHSEQVPSALAPLKGSVGKIQGRAKGLMFAWSIAYKTLTIVYFIFARCGYAGGDIIGLIAVVLNLAYIITTICVKGWKECIIAVIYRIILW